MVQFEFDGVFQNILNPIPPPRSCMYALRVYFVPAVSDSVPVWLPILWVPWPPGWDATTEPFNKKNTPSSPSQVKV